MLASSVRRAVDHRWGAPPAAPPTPTLKNTNIERKAASRQQSQGASCNRTFPDTYCLHSTYVPALSTRWLMLSRGGGRHNGKEQTDHTAINCKQCLALICPAPPSLAGSILGSWGRKRGETYARPRNVVGNTKEDCEHGRQWAEAVQRLLAVANATVRI